MSDKYSIPTDDLLYGLLEECVRREQEWRRRFEKKEEEFDQYGSQATQAMRTQQAEIDRLKAEIKLLQER
jgi:hypothetical protein